MALRLRTLLIGFWIPLLVAGVALAAQEDPAPGAAAGLPDRSGPTVREVDDPRVVDAVVEAFSIPGDSRIAGELLQASSRPGPPGGDVASIEEWFIETAGGEVLAIAVPFGADEPARMGGEGRRGNRVQLLARPVGTLEAESRDGVTRRWPLFAGRPVPSAPASSAGVAVVAATVLAAGAWLLIRRRLARRAARPGQPAIRSHAGEAVPPMDLPGDPADALAVLATQANDEDRNPRSDPMQDRETEA